MLAWTVSHILFRFSHIDKIKEEAIWNDENQRWRIADLVIQKTKLPPAGKGPF